jgi:hypothetical protein
MDVDLTIRQKCVQHVDDARARGMQGQRLWVADGTTQFPS